HRRDSTARSRAAPSRRAATPSSTPASSGHGSSSSLWITTPPATSIRGCPHERRSPSARSRGGNHVSPTLPPSSCLRGGTFRFPHAPSTRSPPDRGRPVSAEPTLLHV